MSGKRKQKGFGAVRWIILVCAVCVLCYSAWQLYLILSAYKKADDEYADLRNGYTAPVSAVPDTGQQGGASDGGNDADDVPRPPISVDWDALAGVNTDIVGWIYVNAEDTISYPICQGDDNEYYLHHTFEKASVFAGAIFEDYHNAADFSDPNTILYGHNMKNGSMFAKLKQLKDADTLNADPYFWILTPEGSYCYEIYAVLETPADSDTYTLYSAGGEEFLDWETKLKNASVVARDTELTEEDHTVLLSTCTNTDDNGRCVVAGKRVYESGEQAKAELAA